jgi:hypothetical protein
MELRSLFRPSAECLAEVERKYGELLEMRDRIVVVHARRGDYCKTAESIEFHGPLSVDYYKKAFEKFPKDSIFLLVSDEPMWWMNALVYISGGFTILMESDEILTFALLQQFRKFILANSVIFLVRYMVYLICVYSYVWCAAPILIWASP